MVIISSSLVAHVVDVSYAFGFFFVDMFFVSTFFCCMLIRPVCMLLSIHTNRFWGIKIIAFDHTEK